MTVATLSEAIVRDMLERFGRSVPTGQEGKRVHDYVDHALRRWATSNAPLGGFLRSPRGEGDPPA